MDLVREWRVKEHCGFSVAPYQITMFEDGSKTESPKKNNLKSTKLSDNKPISGRGRLTDAEILLLQKYYGLAIRRNVGKSVADMSKSIWAIYFHKLSTDENPQHALCPMGEESWCGYNKSIVSGLRKIDYVRICEAEMAVQKASKEARTTKRQIKRKQDALEQSMQDEYSAGNC
ncbi:uncharacterized protein TNCV_3660531 [Trichonephila clavipes]|nr:uncharacterized protein TNCV_3660531 [Trichonephila clavipes]